MNTNQKPHDPVNSPAHYTGHPSGVECIVVTEHMNFCLGNAMKYIWRAGLKSDNPIEDLKKAHWYIEREVKRLQAASSITSDPGYPSQIYAPAKESDV